MKNLWKFCCLLVLILFIKSTFLYSQNLVVTKKGEIFECLLQENSEKSIYFLISIDSMEYSAYMDKSDIAYIGETDLLKQDSKKVSKTNKDIIFTKTGEVLKCNIKTSIGTSLEYSFTIGNNEITNSILRKNVAYYKKSYLETLDLKKKSEEFIMASHDEYAAWVNDSIIHEKNLVVTKDGEIFACLIEKNEEELLHLSIPYLEKNISISLLKDDIAYSGKVKDLLPSGTTDEGNDLIFTQAGVLLKCDIGLAMESTIDYSFIVGNNKIKTEISKDKVAYYKKSYLRKLDLNGESTNFVSKNVVVDEIGDELLSQGLEKNSILLNRDLVVTKDGAIITCAIEEEQTDSLIFTITNMDEEIRISLLREEIAYAGSADILKSIDTVGLADDLIIKKTGEIMRCNITNSFDKLIGYSFIVGDNRISNTISAEQVAYYSRSYKKNMDLREESMRFIYQHNAEKIENYNKEQTYSKDLIVDNDGIELYCKIDHIDQNKIYYSIFEREERKQENISKFNVKYYVKNHAENLEENKVFMQDFAKDKGELIITSDGKYYQGEIIDVGYNSIEFKETGANDKRYFKMTGIIYYGNSFLNTIKEGNKLQHPKYTDLIYKSNHSVLLCQIDAVSSGIVRYSFNLGNRTLFNEIPMDEIVYYGINIFNQEKDPGEMAQESEVVTVQVNKEEGVGELAKHMDVKKDEAVENMTGAGTGPPEEKIEIVAEQVSVITEAEKDPGKTETEDDKLMELSRDNTPPELILFTPEIISAGNFKSVENENEKVRVSGIILDDGKLSELLINGEKVSTTKEGKFDTEVSLLVGDNNINIQAIDRSANVLRESYNIVREHQLVQEPLLKKESDTKPPVLSISYPRPDSPGEAVIVSNATKRVQIAGNVKDESGVFEVMVNNMDATLTSSGDFRINVPLRIGDNKLIVKASDLFFNEIETSIVINRKDATVHYETPEIIEDGAKYYAMLIGVSDYVDPLIPNLDETTINDANRLAEVLKEYYYFEEENLFLLSDPNRSDILRTFDRLSRLITPRDNLLIFFAGHGYYDEMTELGYWLPADAEAEYTANWIYNDVLVANLKRINSKHTLLISDACFSGSIFKTRSLPGSAGIAYQKRYELCSRKAITSGVLETVPNKSVFFKYFIEYLENNQEQLFSASEIFRNIEIPIGNNSPNSPLYGVIQNVGDEGGDFIFLRR